MTIFIILFFLLIITTGFVVVLKRYKSSLEKINFASQYRNTFIQFSNNFIQTFDHFERRGKIDNEKYVWLTKNSNKIQSMLGRTGIVEYMAPFQRYVVSNYQIVFNTLPKFREHIDDGDIKMVDDALLRYIGIEEERSIVLQKRFKNPIIWLQQGFKEFFSLPIYIINWFGIIPDRVVGKITSNIIFKVFAGIGGLVAFISGLVTIIQGKEQTIEFIKRLFHK